MSMLQSEQQSESSTRPRRRRKVIDQSREGGHSRLVNKDHIKRHWANPEVISIEKNVR